MSPQLELMKVKTLLHDFMIKLVPLAQKTAAVATRSALGTRPQVNSVLLSAGLTKVPPSKGLALQNRKAAPLRGTAARHAVVFPKKISLAVQTGQQHEHKPWPCPGRRPVTTTGDTTDLGSVLVGSKARGNGCCQLLGKDSTCISIGAGLWGSKSVPLGCHFEADISSGTSAKFCPAHPARAGLWADGLSLVSVSVQRELLIFFSLWS